MNEHQNLEIIDRLNNASVGPWLVAFSTFEFFLWILYFCHGQDFYRTHSWETGLFKS